MRYVRSDDHRLHFPDGELVGGELVRPFECPERWDYIVAALDAAGMSGVVDPQAVDRGRIAQVHTERYLRFLETAITAGTWLAALAGVALAQTAQKLVTDGEPSAFALCRPPGHHAAADLYGGYCFLNNAAIAAHGFRADGADRVTILDVDFHHGNGTQAIFYDRSDVFFASIHGNPAFEFPHFLGYERETGRGVGEGFNANYPMAPGTLFSDWSLALDDALRRINEFRPDALVVSLGVDTYEADPISSFKLTSNDFTTYGRTIGALNLPTVYVMEGGYAIEQIGINTVNVLGGHLDAA